MLQFFKDYSKNYLQSLEDERVKDIICKRYKLEGHEKHTLEGLGQVYGVTRERIRQIEAQYNNKLTNLMMERERISKPTEIILDLLKVEGVLPKEKFRNLLGANQELFDWEIYYLSLIGVRYYQKYDIIFGKGVSNVSIECTIKRIKERLKAHIIPMSRKELFNQVNRDNFSDNALDMLATRAGAIIEDSQGVTCYSLPVDCSWSAGDLAYLTIWENQRIMSTDEILEDINNRSKDNKQIFNLINQMAHMESIQDISINHWALSEWGLEFRHIIVVMEKVLRKNNKPMDTNKIIEEVVKVLPDVNIGSIRSYTHQEPYTRLCDGRVILTEWKDRYPKAL